MLDYSASLYSYMILDMSEYTYVLSPGLWEVIGPYLSESLIANMHTYEC